MKKIITLLTVLSALCCSAFADVTITDWGIYSNYFTDPRVYDGLMTDIAPTGFSVTANPEMWGDVGRPRAIFQSNTVSPGWLISTDTTSFQVRISGFDDLVTKSGETTPPGNGAISVYIYNLEDFLNVTYYRTTWNGDGVYTFGRDNADMYAENLEAEMVTVNLNAAFDGNYLGDNTQGTIELILPENEVPEPSSLLALVFGGAGTAVLAFRKRK